MPRYPVISDTQFGWISVDGKDYSHDVYILADGSVKKRKKSPAKQVHGGSHQIGPQELKKVCKKRPKVLFIGTGQSGVATLTEDGKKFLAKRKIAWEALPTAKAAKAYNNSKDRKAALIHVTC